MEQYETVLPATEAGIRNVDAAASLVEARDWLKARGIEDIECVVPDQAGVARGKMMPVAKDSNIVPGRVVTQVMAMWVMVVWLMC